MKIIVFGGAGFLGSHVAEELTKKGHEVTVFDLKKSSYLIQGQKSIVGDITNQAAVARAINGMHVVYSFAGIADMIQAKSKPLEVVTNNILGNAIIMEEAKKDKVRRLIFASTLYVYSKLGSFYRSSKQACELLLENYSEIYGLDFTILRYGSLYGPRSDASNWIYSVLKQALDENRIVRHGDGEELREYIHVADAARLSVDVLGEEYKNQYVVITGSQQLKIKDLMVMIKEIMGNKIKLEFHPVDSKEHYEITPYSFNPKLAKRIVNDHYIDLGQGILDLISSIYSKEKK